MHRKEFFQGFARIITDFISVLFAWGLAYYIRPITDLIPNVSSYFPVSNLPDINFFTEFVFYSAIGFIAILFSLFLYSYNIPSCTKKYISWNIIWAYAWGIILWAMSIIAVYALVFHDLIFSRIMLAQAMVFTFIFGIFLRYILHVLFEKIFVIKRNIALVGSEKSLQFLQNIFGAKKEYTLLFTGNSENFIHFLQRKETGSAPNLSDIFFEGGKTQEIFEYTQEIKEISAEKGYHLHIIPHHSETFLGHSHFEQIEGIPLVTFTHIRKNYWFSAWKRFFDIFISFFLLLLLSPVFLFVSIKLRNNIIYASQRVGKNGKLFTIYKFRSMVLNAEDLKEALAEKNHREGPLFKMKDDPRITPFGKFLRKTSIDELPQLWNVMKGDMSLIGPRPHLQEEIAHYTSVQRRILSVRPGISGLAQVSGRSDLSFEREIFFDSYYCEHMNIFLDMKIFFKTPIVLAFGKGSD